MASLDPLGKLAARARSGGAKSPAKSQGQPARRDIGRRNIRLRDIRLPKPGDILSRFYKGREITVRVLESGFEYEGRRFRSLSAIAKAVTGAHWNGLLFFAVVRQER